VASRQARVGEEAQYGEAELPGYSAGLRVARNSEAARRPELGFWVRCGREPEEEGGRRGFPGGGGLLIGDGGWRHESWRGDDGGVDSDLLLGTGG
jgi:hypothetical protein